jgi:hypothetical protein
LSASRAAAVCALSGVEMAHWLLLQSRTSGAFMTAAMFAPSWNAPSEVAPSPNSVTATASDPFSRIPQARPAACGTCVAIGTQIDATLTSSGFHQPEGWPRHHWRIVAGGSPRRRPIAESR